MLQIGTALTFFKIPSSQKHKSSIQKFHYWVHFIPMFQVKKDSSHCFIMNHESTTITKPPFCDLSLLIFPCSFLILISLQNCWDLREMTLSLCLDFCLETFCPLFIVIAHKRFWTDLFAILWHTLSC
jgi:hypothetical protein